MHRMIVDEVSNNQKQHLNFSGSFCQSSMLEVGKQICVAK